MLLWLTIFLFFEALVAIEGVLAYQRRSFSVGQLRGKTHKIPFLAHGGIWGDIVLISPLCASLVSVYGYHWDLTVVFGSLVLGIAGSTAMHLFYEANSRSDSLIARRHLTASGWGHFCYMAAAFTVVSLFYFVTPGVSPVVLWGVSLVLIFHVAIGNHFLLGLVAPRWYKDHPLRDPMAWATVVVSAAVLITVSSIRSGGGF